MDSHRSGVIFLPVALILLCSCSNREHDNPFDPLNPDTHGKPTGLSVSQQENAVRISWPGWPMPDIDSIVVYRRAQNETLFQPIQGIAPGLYEFKDRDIIYGVRYEYCIRVSSGAYQSPASDIVSITPGPALIWIADRYSGYFSCRSHDLSVALGSFGLFNFPWQMAVSTKEKAAWVYSRFMDVIYKIDRSGYLITTVEAMDNILTMQSDTTHRTLWVIAGAPPYVCKLAADGSRQLTITQVASPRALAVDDLNKRVFVVDDLYRRLYCFTLEGAWLATFEGLRKPKALALDARARTLWIADSTRLLQFDYQLMKAGVQLDSLFHASCVVYDPERQQGWLVDLEPMNEPARLIKFDAYARVISQLAEFGHPQCLAVNKFDGSCLLGDVSYLYGGLYVIAESGSSFKRFDQWYPYDIDLDYL